MRRRPKESRYGSIRPVIVIGIAVIAISTVRPGAGFAQVGMPGTRIVDRTPRYGGYLPYGGYPADSGAPLGGYTPFVMTCGPEAGWLKLDYGLGYDDFAGSYHFGSDLQDGFHSGNSYGFETRPFERGRGVWNSYGSAFVNPPPLDSVYRRGR